MKTNSIFFSNFQNESSELNHTTDGLINSMLNSNEEFLYEHMGVIDGMCYPPSSKSLSILYYKKNL